MAKNKVQGTGTENISHNPSGILLDFNTINWISFKSRNISDATMTGNINKGHHFNKTNIIHSILRGVKAHGVNFDNVDIKDCSIKKSSFEDCNFNGAAHINNDFADTQFYKCSFSQTSVTDSEFFNAIFTECDFTNIVISSSRFNKCKFIKCITSNKCIESSLVFDCRFEETNIQPETIIENFGISKKSLVKSQIRDGDKNRAERFIRPDKFSAESVSFTLSAVETFLISYFQEPLILTDGSDDIDATFDYMNWIKISKNSNRFRLLIERYHDFILFNYDKGLAPFWLILKMHKMTDELAINVDPEKADIYRSVMGIHMSLSRLVEEYLKLAEVVFLRYVNEGQINLLVDGPVDQSYYYRSLPEIFEGRTLTIKNIVKHNSPNEMLVIWEKARDLMPVITIFLATRVKFGIQKMVSATSTIKDPGIETKPSAALHSKNEGATAYDIIRTEFGFDNSVNNYLFKLRAILPGDLLLQLHVELRTRIFGKIKKIILDILPHSVTKP